MSELQMLAVVRVACYILFSFYSRRIPGAGGVALSVAWGLIAAGSTMSAFFAKYFPSAQLVQTPMFAVLALLILNELRILLTPQRKKA